MPCNHIMLDLETLSTRKDAAIIQIAALAFDPETGAFGPRFEAFIRNPSGHTDPQTVAWWMQQAQAPRIGYAMSASCDGSLGETVALIRFHDWLRGALDVAEPAALWSHGATADIVWLENAYARNCLPKPWSYKIERDTRTLYALAPGGMPVLTDLDETRKHDAMYDCEVQVQQVVGALRALRQVERERDMWREEYEVTEEARASFASACGQGDADEATADTQRGAGAPPLYDPPPVWSNAEARCEGEANPALRSDGGEYTATGYPIYSHDGD